MVGDILREEREKQGLLLSDISSKTQIRLDYLRAIEDGVYHKIPSEVYVKGYLKLYSRCLGLHVEKILSLYCEERREEDQECAEVATQEKNVRSLRSSYIGATILIVALFLFGLSYFFFLTREARIFPEGNRETPVIVKGELVLKITARETTWIMIGVDNRTMEEYVLKKGAEIRRVANAGFYLKVGNAGGVDIFLNNEHIGKIGEKNEVVKLAVPEGFKLDKKFRRAFGVQKSP